jgi:hypothetical protein
VTRGHDQHVIEALTAQRPCEALREYACLRRPAGVLITRVPLPEKALSNAGVNLLSRSRVRNRNL